MPKNHINIGITILIPLLYEGSFSKIAKKRISYWKRGGCLAVQGFGHFPRRAPYHILLCRSVGHFRSACGKSSKTGRKFPRHFRSGRKKSTQLACRFPAPLAPVPKPNPKKSAKITVITAPLNTRSARAFTRPLI